MLCLETYPFRQHALIIKKKKRKKETQYYIKISSHLFREQKKPKKKKIKNPKTQNVFPNQNSYSLRLQILLCSFKHTAYGTSFGESSITTLK